jgi:UPF0042 nucleotide-binding protein
MELLLITGLSGAGKSCALRALEDNGFYCADNIPPVLISEFVTSLNNYRESIAETSNEQKVAIVADVRVINFEGIVAAMEKLTLMGYQYKIIFLDATDDALDKRYKFTRRNHPLAKDKSTQDGIAKERKMLEPIREMASIIIDTTNYNEKQLKSKIIDFITKDREDNKQISLVSFGFKRGTPIDLDMLFDVRFLSNPYYVDSLRQLSGLDTEVRDYIFKDGMAQKFTDKIVEIIKLIFDSYAKEVKSYLNVGIGCTGGKHRSVSIVNALEEKLKAAGLSARSEHRDLLK